ncbi:hypothetical protein M7I_6650 [Glarea lozoyensis 74030]|uniref:Uncharacterized protein n=1 Tax=Glarea lozoyensis (strain ATCC 74030 / MF5533) TaxID=1104152 RepID=H0EV57_GLAL7|nr:hypothetical protein M7I_6650 [Glarea lozoyensis 74030]
MEFFQRLKNRRRPTIFFLLLVQTVHTTGISDYFENVENFVSRVEKNPENPTITQPTRRLLHKQPIPPFVIPPLPIPLPKKSNTLPSTTTQTPHKMKYPQMEVFIYGMFVFGAAIVVALFVGLLVLIARFSLCACWPVRERDEEVGRGGA